MAGKTSTARGASARKRCVEQRGGSLSIAGHGIAPECHAAFAAHCVNTAMTKKHASASFQKKSARAHSTQHTAHSTHRSLQHSHLSSGQKTDNDANEDAVSPPTLGPRGHEVEHAGRRGDECASEGGDAAAQEALQLRRRNLELHVVGGVRQRLAHALRAEAEYSMDEAAREHDLAELVEWHTHVLGEVAVEE